MLLKILYIVLLLFCTPVIADNYRITDKFGRTQAYVTNNKLRTITGKVISTYDPKTGTIRNQYGQVISKYQKVK